MFSVRRLVVRTAILVTALLFSQMVAAQRRPSVGKFYSAKQLELNSDLRQALTIISETFEIPVLAELAVPLPQIVLPRQSITLPRAITEIEMQAHDYRCRIDRGVLHCFCRNLLRAPGNFLSHRLLRFNMPADAAQLRADIEGALQAAEPTIHLPSPKLDGQDVALAGGTVEMIDIREVLVLALSSSRSTSMLITFPSRNPRTDCDVSFALASWYMPPARKVTAVPPLPSGQPPPCRAVHFLRR